MQWSENQTDNSEMILPDNIKLKRLIADNEKQTRINKKLLSENKELLRENHRMKVKLASREDAKYMEVTIKKLITILDRMRGFLLTKLDYDLLEPRKKVMFDHCMIELTEIKEEVKDYTELI